MKLFFVSLLFFICQEIFAATVKDRLYINSGQIEAIDSSLFAYKAYNPSATFQANNSLLKIQTGDSLWLTVINNDISTHTFALQSKNSGTVIPAGDSIKVKYLFSNSGIYLFYDTDKSQRSMGLAGMLTVENSIENSFYWNIKEHQKSRSDSISAGFPVNWNQYYPDYFLINGNSNPHINDDSIARVNGQVGDSIFIYISNTGNSVHSLHFHGYHAEIIYSSGFPQHTGRSKDTFPIYPMQSLVLLMIPDKPGEYPVHDHNLVAVSGGKYYPNGMFLTMLIQ